MWTITNHKAGISGMAHDFGFRVGARRAYLGCSFVLGFGLRARPVVQSLMFSRVQGSGLRVRAQGFQGLRIWAVRLLGLVDLFLHYIPNPKPQVSLPRIIALKYGGNRA